MDDMRYPIDYLRGDHLRVGPVLLAHYRPPTAAPLIDYAAVITERRERQPGSTFGTERVVATGRWNGWAIRPLRLTVALRGPRLGRLAGSWHARKARRRVRATGQRVMGGEQGSEL